MDLPANTGNRIGVLGGTFDPVHFGHFSVARTVRQALQLDSVLFIPAAHPPHKHKAFADFADRAAMLDLAVSDEQVFFVSRIEALRQGESYTIDTLAQLREHYGWEKELFFILGEDAFFEIDSWKDYERLPGYAHLVIIEREVEYKPKFSDHVVKCFKDFRLSKKENVWSCEDLVGEIFVLQMKPVEISSTLIRERVMMKKDFSRLTPKPVIEYINKKNLYR